MAAASPQQRRCGEAEKSLPDFWRRRRVVHCIKQPGRPYDLASIENPHELRNRQLGIVIAGAEIGRELGLRPAYRFQDGSKLLVPDVHGLCTRMDPLAA